MIKKTMMPTFGAVAVKLKPGQSKTELSEAAGNDFRRMAANSQGSIGVVVFNTVDYPDPDSFIPVYRDQELYDMLVSAGYNAIMFDSEQHGKLVLGVGNPFAWWRNLPGFKLQKR